MRIFDDYTYVNEFEYASFAFSKVKQTPKVEKENEEKNGQEFSYLAPISSEGFAMSYGKKKADKVNGKENREVLDYKFLDGFLSILTPKKELLVTHS
ncbi:MAG: hypothetical protein A2X61_15950 [Ignavibacteria bacterium GWB2_35_12]|nr:MAG: hypothetical protein A2X63_07245 [Ignavibacteria bacterium GWA2_35_8]OGU40865.1 MAG: hypothetical protein A2X61_15950 [Ignavibacteria bacterium GWB2_35_12]OGU92717.1 MAG: hypothetical protein A2220_11155 [Ignavibacteria bacterium RIFOXYA2_FULL_35_10]OGV24692.1 MAG: hypothetical protein A2475_14725 [Ignavibacteria bacterium RIFOXYC2_FULL_35_21]